METKFSNMCLAKNHWRALLLMGALVFSCADGTHARPSLAPSSSSAASDVQFADGIVAIVNKSVITLSQLRALTYSRIHQLAELYRGAELEKKIAELNKEALQDLIDRQLVLEEFKALETKGAKIPDYVIDDRIQAIIREEFQNDRAAFMQALKASGTTLSRLREIERDKIIVMALRQTKLKDGGIASPAEVQAYYDKNKSKFATKEEVKLRMIVIREASDEDIFAGISKKQVAEEVREKIKTAADFERIAQLYSEDYSTRESGGDWGWIERKILHPELAKVAFTLPVGKVSPVIEVERNRYILLVEERRHARIPPLEDIRDAIERALMVEEKKGEYERWMDSLRRKAFIKILL